LKSLHEEYPTLYLLTNAEIEAMLKQEIVSILAHRVVGVKKLKHENLIAILKQKRDEIRKQVLKDQSLYPV